MWAKSGQCGKKVVKIGNRGKKRLKVKGDKSGIVGKKWSKW